MQTNHFIKYISDHQSARLITETDASSLVKEFPYCQSGQILLAIHLNQNNHLLFEQQLKKSAIYSSDRKRLFDLISTTKEEEKQEIKPIEVVKPIETPTIELEQTEPIVELAEQPKEILETIPPSPKPEPETKVEPKPEKVSKDEKEKLLEMEYINQAISNSYTLEMESEEDLRDNTLDEKKPAIEQIEELNETTEFTFSDWLKHLPTSEPQEKTKKAPYRKVNLDLIDKFIQEDPKIKPKKTEFYSPVNMARLSVIDDSDLVSETLALIQVEQGNLEAALKTYQKLSLKNPEKRTYFANQIKILNQKIK